MALLRSPDWPTAGGPRRRAAAGTDWLLAMQNRDGGWAAFDVDIDNEVLTKVPFADHNAMLDPSCADITARVLELLGHARLPGRSSGDRPRAWTTSGRRRSREGCWYGRWGVNYIYGTWQVLAGPEGHRLPDGPPGPGEGGRLARVGPAGRRRLGRDLPQLRRPALDGHGRRRPPRRRPGPSSA